MLLTYLRKIVQDHPIVRYASAVIVMAWAGIVTISSALHLTVPVPILWIGWVICAWIIILALILIGYEVYLSVRNIHDGILVVSGVNHALPSVTPDSGYINFLDFQYHPEETLSAIGISIRSGKPNERMVWNGVSDGVKIVVKNYSDKTFFDINFLMQVAFLNVVQLEGGGFKTDGIIKERDYHIPIPVLKGHGEEEFVFYAYNLSPYYVNFYPRGECLAGKLDKQQKISVSTSTGLPVSLPFSLPPSTGITL